MEPHVVSLKNIMEEADRLDNFGPLINLLSAFRSAYAMLVTFKEALIDYILIIQDLSGIHEAYH